MSIIRVVNADKVILLAYRFMSLKFFQAHFLYTPKRISCQEVFSVWNKILY